MTGNIQSRRCRGIADVGRRKNQNKYRTKNIYTLFFLVVGDIHRKKIGVLNRRVCMELIFVSDSIPTWVDDFWGTWMPTKIAQTFSV